MGKKNDPLDPLKLIRRLVEDGGFTGEQAEVMVEILMEVIVANQVTKHDLKDLFQKIVLTLGGMIVTSSVVILSIMAELLG